MDAELKLYQKKLLREKIIRTHTFLDNTTKKAKEKNLLLYLLWRIGLFFLRGFFGICLSIEYFIYWGWKIKDFSFDAGFMEYQVKYKGMTNDEVILYLKEKQAELNRRIAKDSISKKEIQKAESAIEYLTYEYEKHKEIEKENPVKKESIYKTTHPDWINQLWENLMERRCVIREEKSNFILLMTGAPPVNRITWCKGLVKLVQFVEEGLQAGKIELNSQKGMDRFIMEYIQLNFRPNLNIPNQKLKHYTTDRIKTAQNERLKIKPKERVTEFFVFEG